MKALLPATLILLTIACGGVKPAKIDFHLPALPAGDVSDANFRQGWEQLQKGDSDSAYKSFQLSEVSLDRKQAAFGYVFLARQKYSAASNQFAQALATNPENVEAGMGMAMIQEFEGQVTEAFRAYASLLARAPDDTWLKLKYESIKTSSTQEYLRQAEAVLNSDKKKYVECLEQAHFFSPEITAITLKIGDFFYGENEWPRSRPFYEAALEQEPYNQDVLQRLAAIYEKDGKFDLALVTLDRLLALKPGDPVLEGEKKRINDRFQEMNLPEKFKRIFVKAEINREEMAALIGYYFDRYIEMDGAPVIITDIDGSFAREQIIKTCTAGIMSVRPDHSFDRFSIPDRATFAVNVKALIGYLKARGHVLRFTPLPDPVESLDLSPLHKNYETIKFLVNAQILPLDADRLFNPTRSVSPNDVIFALKKILNSIND
jgi:tetratricopeptide (TPR) repeat protein